MRRRVVVSLGGGARGRVVAQVGDAVVVADLGAERLRIFLRLVLWGRVERGKGQVGASWGNRVYYL